MRRLLIFSLLIAFAGYGWGQVSAGDEYCTGETITVNTIPVVENATTACFRDSRITDSNTGINVAFPNDNESFVLRDDTGNPIFLVNANNDGQAGNFGMVYTSRNQGSDVYFNLSDHPTGVTPEFRVDAGNQVRALEVSPLGVGIGTAPTRGFDYNLSSNVRFNIGTNANQAFEIFNNYDLGGSPLLQVRNERVTIGDLIDGGARFLVGGNADIFGRTFTQTLRVTGGNPQNRSILTSTNGQGDATWSNICDIIDASNCTLTGVTGPTGPQGPAGADGTDIVDCDDENKVPHWNSAGELTCGQIYDDGTQVSIGTSTPNGTYLLTVDAGSSSDLGVYIDGTILSSGNGSFSDRRLKEGIVIIENPLEKLISLSGYNYEFRPTDEFSFPKGQQIGVIAQELKEVFPELVREQPNGYLSVNYDGLIPVAIEAIKEQQTIIETHESTIAELKTDNDAQQAQIDKLTDLVNQLLAKNDMPQIEKTEPASSSSMTNGLYLDGIVLGQNKPNPFDGATEIELYLPKEVESARLYVYNIAGKQLQAIDLKERGSSSVNIKGNELEAGMYIYTLVADGKEVASKRMILTD